MFKLKFLCLVIPLALILSKWTNAQIVKVQAIDSVLVNIVADDSLNFNVYLYPDICRDNNFDVTPYLNVQNPYDSAWIFFVDLFPEKGWGHRCKYILVDKLLGQLTILNDNIPPRLYWLTWEEISVPFPHQVVIQSTDTTFKTNSSYEPDPNKYALLVTWNAWEDTARWNNLSHIYTGLKLTYGFKDENIFVLSDDGMFNRETQDLDLDNIDSDCDFDGPCTKDSIRDILTYFQTELDGDDIFLFYVTTHGDTLDGDPNDTTALVLWDSLLWDYELEEMVENIHCSQKIFCIDACYAGGFIDELSRDHSVINVPVPRHVETLRTWRNFDFFSYAWGTAVRGWHPKNAIEPYYADYKVGMHPDLQQVYFKWNKPDTIPDLISFGGNEDGFIQFGEVFNYAKYLDGQTMVSGIEFINDGFRGDLLTLNGIEGRVDTTQSVSGPFLIGRKLTLAPGVTLNQNGSVKFYLNKGSEIYVSEGATFSPWGHFADIIGCSGESLIRVKGNLRLSSMDFSASAGAVLNISFENTENEYSFSHFDFNNCRIKAVTKSLSFDESSFTNSSLQYSIGDLVLSKKNTFTNSTVSLSHPGSHSSSCKIYGNIFNNTSSLNENAVITIEEYPYFLIDSNQIHYNSKRGIELFYAGASALGDKTIVNNLIQFTGTPSQEYSELGVHSYMSNVTIKKNTISGNDYGIAGFHRSNLIVIGDSSAEYSEETQQIINNTISQCVFNTASFPLDFSYNVVGTTYTSEYPYIKTVEYEEIKNETGGCPDWSGEPTYIVENNCWINSMQDPSERLLPVGAYDWDPVWCPPDPAYTNEKTGEALYYSALSEIENGTYPVAESIFKQVINEYPVSIYSQASIKGLFDLNPLIYQDYTTLKVYCDSLAANPGDSLLGKTAEWLSLHCNIKGGEYQGAINSLDSIISNPGSSSDSIFALIDLDYVFTKLEDTSMLKSSVLSSKYFDIISKTPEQYSRQRLDRIEKLLKPTKISARNNNPGKFLNDQFNFGQITSLYPNPLHNKLNVKYSLKNGGKIRISVYTAQGRCMSETECGTRGTGYHEEQISFIEQAEGMYFICLFFENLLIDSEKISKVL